MEDVTMKRFFICVAVCFILFSAIPAQAGRTQMGNILSPECTCGVSGQVCYDENNNWQRCDGEYGMASMRSEGKVSKPSSLPTGKTRDFDAGSVGLFVLLTAFLLRRFIL